MNLPDAWREVLGDQTREPYYQELQAFLRRERTEHTVFPEQHHVFAALELTPYEQANVLLLGQDPYHDVGQAHGLCFSVQPGIKIPPSLRNIYQELRDDVGCATPKHGYLVSWARQGVLMLNAVLTVRAHAANSHKNQGWERFTDKVIQAMSDKRSPIVFVLWGRPAQQKRSLIASRHIIIESPHPSPLSARRGFHGSRPFSKINAALLALGQRPIDWQLPTDVDGMVG